MSESKACIKCGRGIDQWASICPFCNWDQHAAPPTPEEVAAPSPAASYVPPEEGGLKRKALMLGAGALLLVASFGVGVVINRDGAPTRAPETLEEQAAEHNAENIQKPRRADTPLVPAGAGGVEQPITSAPAAGSPTSTNPNGGLSEYDRTDATAVSAVEYSEMAKRAKAEKERMASLVDPRSLTGPAYAQAPRRPQPVHPVTQHSASASQIASNPDLPASRTNPSVHRAVRTRPIAEYRPVPSLRANGVAKLTLLIGADGEVKRVSIDQPLSGGNTAQLLAAVQRWRFKPATEDGEPVAAPYSVEIRFQ
jgi:protein TonB